MDDQPWHGLPPDITRILRPGLGELADEIIEAVRTIPAYSRPLEGEFGAGVRAGVEGALQHFLDEVQASGPVARPDVYRALGRGEMRAGRSLESLLSAYRLGARVAWRRFAAAGVRAGLDPDTLYLLAESLFAYIDMLSAESAEGHAQAQSAAAGEAQVRRRRLVRFLIREPPDSAAVEALALQATWPLPRTLAVLVVGPRRRAAVVSRLPGDAIADTVDDLAVAVVPDPDGPGRRAMIERAVIGARATAALGTTVEWPRAAVSYARAQAALELGDGSPALIVARERAGELLLRSDPRLAQELAADRLAPLADLSPGARQRLRETLRVWLDEQGRLAPMAARLGIHPQTARYRTARLRELFGGALENADERFWLALALRATDGAEGR